MKYVVDQSAMRQPEVRVRISSETDSQFLLLDTALIEMMQSEQWEETIRGSMAPLAQVMQRVVFLEPVSIGLRYELRSGKALQCPRRVNHRVDKRLRKFLRSVVASDTSAEAMAARAEVLRIRTKVEREEGDAEGEKLRVLKRTTDLLHDRGADEVAKLRRKKLTLPELHAYLRAGALGAYDGFTREHRLSLAQAKPANTMTLRFFFLKIREAVRWHWLQGLENSEAQKRVHDRRDHEYVLAGSYFDGLLARDNAVRAAEVDLRRFLGHELDDGELAVSAKDWRLPA